MTDFAILYTPDAEADLDTLDRPIARQIVATIGKRLAVDPGKYGLPLRGSLKGRWKLRVGDYRVVFQVKKSEVLILRVGHREKIYDP